MKPSIGDILFAIGGAGFLAIIASLADIAGLVELNATERSLVNHAMGMGVLAAVAGTIHCIGEFHRTRRNPE
jgi:hypothetical protein